MKVRFVKKSKLWLPNIGVFEPEEIIEVTKKKGKQMLDTGYFKEIKEKKSKEVKAIEDTDIIKTDEKGVDE
jgi:hypothetical protein